MAKREEKQEKVKDTKKESELVTKESLCAVCALFSALALLILFTNEWIFGDIGGVIHGFLTGILGYCAYPVFLATLYLSFTALIGKRFIKNRKATAYISLALVCVALLVHTATTYAWDNDGYLAACFNAGENFPKATACGWIGALPVLALVSATTKVGAIIIFAVLTVFFAYLAYLVLRKGGIKKSATEQKTQTASTATPVEIPLSTVADTPQPPLQVAPETAAAVAPTQGQAYQEPMQSYASVDAPQRPAFAISDEPAQETTSAQSRSSGFSPFGVAQPTQSEPVVTDREAYERSRAFLFGATPEEIYRKNLIFDPTSRANNRPPVATGASGGYTPSYSDAYQASVNDGDRPTKIFTDRTQPTSTTESIAPLSPIQEPTIQPQPVVSYPTFEEERVEPMLSPVMEEPPVIPTVETPIVEETPTRTDEGYRRHDYMDLFSPANPNVFGNDETGRATAQEVFSGRDTRGDDFPMEEETPVRDELPIEEEMPIRGEERGRGIDIFDEEEDDTPYTLRTDFDEEVRGRAVEEETPALPTPIVEPEKPTPPPPPKPRVIRPYVRVPLDDFDCRDVEPTQNPQEVEETKATIIATLEEFKVTGAAIASVTHGPTVTRYNVTIPRNISPKKVVALDDPIAISLRSSGVNIYPNYDDGVVSIEVPNKDRQFVQLGCMLTGDTFVNAKPSSLMFTMGKDVGNRKVYGDISKMIHMLVAGSSGSGKSVFLGSLIISLIYKYSPEELRLILIDPKKTEFVLYNDLPHLMINEIITDANKAVQSLNWAIGEMNRRYGLFEQMSRAGTYVVNLDQYNQHIEKAERLPKIVIIIDELADLMLAAKKDVEDRIQNLTQKARAAGIHLVVATQRPSTDVITGVIKSNLNTRIAFAVATDVDSRVILDQSGAQKLLGKGDFLYTMQGINTPIRVQSAFISPEDSQRVVNFIKSNNEAYYDESATAYINNVRSGGGDGGSFGNGDEIEPVYIEALRCVILSNSASISLIQRKCSIGYNKAGKIVEWMEEMGYISSFDGAKARKVLITKEEFESKYGSLN
ncbi:MAG: hypothetical protein J6U60_00035 [Clostridia bacterium]|nr:hypothetical protein [Clostridia bacterium]